MKMMIGSGRLHKATIATTLTWLSLTCCSTNAFTSTARSVLTTPAVFSSKSFCRHPGSTHLTMTSSSDSSKTETFMEYMSKACSEALSRPVKLEPARGGGASGGGGASTSAAVDSLTDTKYFIKAASASGGGGDMLRAEYMGVKEMSESETIKVPAPIAYGIHDSGLMRSRAFVVFEYLNFCGGGSGYELGKQLAKVCYAFKYYSSEVHINFILITIELSTLPRCIAPSAPMVNLVFILIIRLEQHLSLTYLG